MQAKKANAKSLRNSWKLHSEIETQELIIVIVALYHCNSFSSLSVAPTEGTVEDILNHCLQSLPYSFRDLSLCDKDIGYITL